MAALVVSVSTLVSMNAAVAAPEAPGPPADGAYVQFQVRPTDGDATALVAALSADGYDVDGGGAGLLFVHAPASAGTALAARTDLTVVAANPINFSHAPAPVSQDSLLPARLQGGGYETFYGGYRTADAYVQFTDDLGAAYPDLVKVMKFGETYTQSNDLRVVCVTADADTGCQLQPDVDKARFLFVAQIHARELTTSEMTWRMLTLLTDDYGQDADITALLDETEIWIVPQINPDGVETVEKGFNGESGGYTFQRKNMHPEGGCGPTTLGTDLNRNYANSNWGGVGSDGNPCGETYHGASAGSEPETYNVQDLMKDIFEDQRGPDPDDPAPDSTRGSMLTLHTYGNLVMFPYGDFAPCAEQRRVAVAGLPVQPLQRVRDRRDGRGPLPGLGHDRRLRVREARHRLVHVRDRPERRHMLRLPPGLLVPGRLLEPQQGGVPVRRTGGPAAVRDGPWPEPGPGQVEEQERQEGRDHRDR